MFDELVVASCPGGASEGGELEEKGQEAEREQQREARPDQAVGASAGRLDRVTAGDAERPPRQTTCL